MKKLFDELSYKVSKTTTKQYSASFSLGILALSPKIRNPIYAIYGYVRLADEIVDSFHGFNKQKLLSRFRQETTLALEEKISLNPILQSFQETVHKYQIDFQLIDQFLRSMEMDLHKIDYDSDLYKEYILGSAEVVGLMCLQIFVEGDKAFLIIDVNNFCLPMHLNVEYRSYRVVNNHSFKNVVIVKLCGGR